MDLSEFGGGGWGWYFSLHGLKMLRTDTGSNVESTEKKGPATAEHSVGRFKALRL